VVNSWGKWVVQILLKRLTLRKKQGPGTGPSYTGYVSQITMGKRRIGKDRRPDVKPQESLGKKGNGVLFFSEKKP